MKYIYSLALVLFLASCGTSVEDIVDDTSNMNTTTTRNADGVIREEANITDSVRVETVEIEEEIPVRNEPEVSPEGEEAIVEKVIVENPKVVEVPVVVETEIPVAAPVAVEEVIEIEEIPAATIEPRKKRGGVSTGSSTY